MSTWDLMEDSFPHGTVAGWNSGCRGSHCPSPLQCREAFTLWSGDYGYRRMVAEGLTPAEIYQARNASKREDEMGYQAPLAVRERNERVREWCAANSIAVASRGKIPVKVLEAYEASISGGEGAVVSTPAPCSVDADPAAPAPSPHWVIDGVPSLEPPEIEDDQPQPDQEFLEAEAERVRQVAAEEIAKVDDSQWAAAWETLSNAPYDAELIRQAVDAGPAWGEEDLARFHTAVTTGLSWYYDDLTRLMDENARLRSSLSFVLRAWGDVKDEVDGLETILDGYRRAAALDAETIRTLDASNNRADAAEAKLARIKEEIYSDHAAAEKLWNITATLKEGKQS